MAAIIPALSITKANVADTIERIQRRGGTGAEGVMLWLGRRSATVSEVSEAYEPHYWSEADRFVVPPEGMSKLMDRICETGHSVVAQVHSHPQYAFHSQADEAWALIKHIGAYSIVLPWFAARTTIASFWRDAVVFVMQPDGKWLELSEKEKEAQCQTK